MKPAILAISLIWLLFTPHPALSAFDPEHRIAEVLEGISSRSAQGHVLDAANLTRGCTEADLLDPVLRLPHADRFAREAISPLIRYADTCRKADLPKATPPGLRKVLLWHRYLCGDLTKLPARFFAQSPKMHPNGTSFAQLARLRNLPPTGLEEREVFHVGELLEREIGPLPPTALRDLLAGAPIVLSGQNVWIRREERSGEGLRSTYVSVPWPAFQKGLEGTELVARPWIAGEGCILRQGSLCWQLKPVSQLPSVVRAKLVLGLLILLALGAIFAIWAKRSREKDQENERRKLMLQMVTHEVRTPVTAVRLALEEMRSCFDGMPETAQRAFMRLCEESQRLGRVAEASRAYLEMTSSGLSLKNEAVPSLNDFFADMTAPFGKSVTLEPLAQDIGGELDRYWTELCLGNLVRNALTHGAAPVRVRLRTQNGAYRGFTVEDAGQAQLPALDFLISQGARANPKGGMGLGLSIVRQVAQAMGGKLELTHSPNAFSIVLSGGSK